MSTARYDNQFQKAIQYAAEKNGVSKTVVGDCVQTFFTELRKGMYSREKKDYHIPYFGWFRYNHKAEYMRNKFFEEKRLKDEKLNETI